MGKAITDRRPWGYFERFTLNERTTVKLLHVKAGKRLSYQYHKNRSEFWKVVKGEVRAVLKGKPIRLSEGDSVKVPARTPHRIEGIKDAIVLEIAYGKFDEEDIVRIEDDYNRA